MKLIRNDPALKQRRRELRRNRTEAEQTFWAHVRDRRFLGLKFIRQYSAGPYILDFYCPKMKLAIELDGGQHTEDCNKEYDAARSAYLKSQGIDVMRFWNHEVLQETDSVLNMIAQKITPPSPLTSRGVTEKERKIIEGIGSKSICGVRHQTCRLLR